MRKIYYSLIAVAALGGAAVFAAQAQTPPPGARNLPQQTRPMRSPDDRAARMTARCDDRFAKQVGRLAYIQARLAITPSQQGAFERWKSVKTDIAKRQEAACASRTSSAGPQRDAANRPTPGERPSPTERMAKMEDRLKQRLADLSQERPALEALYASLTPEQKNALGRDRGGERGMRGHRGFERGGFGRPGMERRGGPDNDRAPI